MNIKALTITALLGASLASGQAFAWADNYVKPYKVKKVTTHTHHVYVKPKGNWHQHPANPYTKDTYHNHPNGKNYHVHNYGKGGGHTHHGYTYTVCPYPGH